MLHVAGSLAAELNVTYVTLDICGPGHRPLSASSDSLYPFIFICRYGALGNMAIQCLPFILSSDYWNLLWKTGPKIILVIYCKLSTRIRKQLLNIQQAIVNDPNNIILSE